MRTFQINMAAAILLLLVMGGCGPHRKFNAVPEALVSEAHIPGMPNVRTWGDHVEEHFIRSLVDGITQEQAYHAAHPEVPMSPTADILALSGGGENGAYGAGILCGWTTRGDRPAFKLVTGISTGALIAPLAFLGPEYDGMLKQAYTTITAKEVLKSRGMLAIINRDGIADTDPLAELIKVWVTDDALKAIAAEHAKGRRLLVATVNIEAQRPVIWDMGAIASSNHPGATELFRQVMLASASIPAAFEPQYIEVEAGGKTYEEMHVDGGTMSQVFLWGAGVDLHELGRRVGIAKARRPIRLFIVRNARFDPEYKNMRALFMDITGRAVSTLIKTQGIGDIFRLYVRAQHDGMDFNLASIPPEFTGKLEEPFDSAYMNELFQYGYDQAAAGYAWRKTPPFVDELSGQTATALPPQGSNP